MACPSGLQVLFMLLVMIGLLESHAWARASRKDCTPLYDECMKRYPPSFKGMTPCKYTREEWKCRREESEKRFREIEAAEKKAAQARNLTINIEQVNKDPFIIIHIQVTNNSTMPVTFINGSSPLDRDAFSLGLFRITPDNLPMVNFGCPVPSKHSSPSVNDTFVEIGPGVTLYNTVAIFDDDPVDKEGWERMLDVATQVEVQMKGRWRGIWAKTRAEAMREAELFKESGHVFQSFESNVIELEI